MPTASELPFLDLLIGAVPSTRRGRLSRILSLGMRLLSWLSGVRLVTSDVRNGLKKTMQTDLGGTTWQRCRVHFLRNVVLLIPQHKKAMVAGAVDTIFTQPDGRVAKQQRDEVAQGAAAQPAGSNRATQRRRQRHARFHGFSGSPLGPERGKKGSR